MGGMAEFAFPRFFLPIGISFMTLLTYHSQEPYR